MYGAQTIHKTENLMLLFAILKCLIIPSTPTDKESLKIAGLKSHLQSL